MWFPSDLVFGLITAVQSIVGWHTTGVLLWALGGIGVVLLWAGTWSRSVSLLLASTICTSFFSLGGGMSIGFLTTLLPLLALAWAVARMLPGHPSLRWSLPVLAGLLWAAMAATMVVAVGAPAPTPTWAYVFHPMLWNNALLSVAVLLLVGRPVWRAVRQR